MTFGPLPVSGTVFGFMTDALDPIKQHLIDYPKPERAGVLSPGGALGLVGGHGSGKTYLLSWLRSQILGMTSSESRIAYAKADTPQFSDVYGQLLRNFSHQGLQEITTRALREIAKSITGAALATEGTARRIGQGADLEFIYDGKAVDKNELFLSLKRTIRSVGPASAVAEKVAEMVGLLEDPTIGLAAFDWLCGGPVGNPVLPVSGPLFATTTNCPGDDASDVAVAALEALAALFRLAGIPLILMVDQMENFLPNEEAMAGGTSTIKKLSEQVGGQKAFIVLAGTRVAWDRFPRDVGPRIVRREPLPVGNLKLEETTALLHAYLGGTTRFTPHSVAQIHLLSGGNPREILQTAHQCFKLVAGRLADLDEATIFRAAQASGTLAEREKSALTDIDRVLGRVGVWAQERRLRDGNLVHRFIEDEKMPVAALVVASATDPLAEVTAAERLASMRSALVEVSNEAELVVVTVGYSSERVRRLVETISHIVIYGSPAFEQELQSTMSALVLARRKAHASSTSQPLPWLQQVLDHINQLQADLGDLKTQREAQAQSTAVALEKGVATANEEAQAASTARKRWELLETLESLAAALSGDAPGDEAGLVRSMLITNEAYVRVAALDYLGSLYLRALDLDRQIYWTDDPVRGELKRFRSTTISSMRDELLRRNAWLQDPRYWLGATGAVVGIGCATALILVLPGILPYGWPIAALYAGVAGTFAVGGAIVGALMDSPERRHRDLQWRLENVSLRLEQRVEAAPKSSSP